MKSVFILVQCNTLLRKNYAAHCYCSLCDRLNLRKKLVCLHSLAVFALGISHRTRIFHEFAFDNKALKTFVEFWIWWKRSKFGHCPIRIRTSSHLSLSSSSSSSTNFIATQVLQKLQGLCVCRPAVALLSLLSAEHHGPWAAFYSVKSHLITYRWLTTTVWRHHHNNDFVKFVLADGEDKSIARYTISVNYCTMPFIKWLCVCQQQRRYYVVERLVSYRALFVWNVITTIIIIKLESLGELHCSHFLPFWLQQQAHSSCRPHSCLR